MTIRTSVLANFYPWQVMIMKWQFFFFYAIISGNSQRDDIVDTRNDPIGMDIKIGL